MEEGKEKRNVATETKRSSQTTLLSLLHVVPSGGRGRGQNQASREGGRGQKQATGGGGRSRLVVSMLG